MLFEQESITPGKRAAALNSLFCAKAARPRLTSCAEHVPVEVLEAHGELESHLRYMLEAACKSRPDKASQRQLRLVEKLLYSLPESIMQTLPATPETDWMRCYRDLIKLHELIDDAGLCIEAAEYATIIEKMVRLAEAVSENSAVQVSSASIFTLCLMQAHLRRYRPGKRRPSRKKKRTHKRHHAHHSRKAAEGEKSL